jgi:3-deoxy-manno-octulosonate cytidylyltransferase (CMP-KDO synthetase)
VNFADAPPPNGPDEARTTPRVLGVIPARLASTRLPDKPLYPLLGRPLIEWVWRRVERMEVLDGLVVATDSERVAEVCERLGAPVELTPSTHPSGTDRIAEVAERAAYRDYGVVVNIQGDEPLLRAAHVEAAVALVRDQGWPVGTCAAPLGSEEARRDPGVVKVVRADGGRALYFSRAAVPYSRDGKPSAEVLSRPPYLRHVGLYAYRREALMRWVSMPPSPLERVEMLEQLRALEAGIDMGVALVATADGGVDTPADVVRVEARLKELGLAEPLGLAGSSHASTRDP